MLKILSLLFMLCIIPISEASVCGQCTGQSNCNSSCLQNTCCGNMGGILYCDSSAGRYVCNNGYYSSCYCTRHAIMDLQRVEGCCLWQGGVLTIGTTGAVICNNGNVSEMCTAADSASTTRAW